MDNSNLDDLIYYNKLEKYKHSEQDTINKFDNCFKYYIIRRLPYLLIIFILILIILIYARINTLSKKYHIMIDICIQLIGGINITIFGVYLWSVKSEYYNILDNLFSVKKELSQYLETRNIKYLYKNIL